MLILGIESSCDDTSVALVDCSDSGHIVISQKTASQIDIHQKYGGVVPEVAGRAHAEKIVPLIEEVLREASHYPLEGVAAGGVSPLRSKGHTPRPVTADPLKGVIKPDAIAVTAGPGLLTGLIVGTEAAQTLSYAWNIPLVAVNHIAGHIHSVEILDSKLQDPNKLPIQNRESKIENLKSKIQFPALALVVSGGHTELVFMQSNTDMKILGRTKDDAAGECFDKIAKLVGLPYPGGPQISRLAESGKVDAIEFPRPMLKENNYDFSFAGLKTSALYWLRDNAEKSSTAYHLPPTVLHNFCASFEQAIVDTVVGKTMKAVAEFKPKTVILGGGVSANKKIRKTLAEQIALKSPITYFLLPITTYSMDNAAMIAVAGYYKDKTGDFTSWHDIQVDPNWRVDQKKPQ